MTNRCCCASSLTRILVTQDEDLLAITAQWQATARVFPGIVFSRQIAASFGELIDDLQRIAEGCTPEEMTGRVIHLPLR